MLGPERWAPNNRGFVPGAPGSILGSAAVGPENGVVIAPPSATALPPGRAAGYESYPTPRGGAAVGGPPPPAAAGSSFGYARGGGHQNIHGSSHNHGYPGYRSRPSVSGYYQEGGGTFGPIPPIPGRGGDRLSLAGANLRQIDWRSEHLSTFQKNFYQEHPNTTRLTPHEVERILRDNDLSISGSPPLPKPIRSFEEACLPDWLTHEIQHAGFRTPYPIQIMGWPVALRGRDMIGIAQTGSGKTVAYLLPGMLHIKAQSPLRGGDGPIVLVLAPTRELAMQIKKEADRFGCRSGLRNCCIYGGVPKNDQSRELRRGVEILIATPGRLLDFLESGNTNLKRVTYLVLDEADRMLDMGFEPQMRRIVSQIRPDRQTLMWSATWPREVQSLARDFCREDPVKVTVGSHDLQANQNINQVIDVCNEHEKHLRFLNWLYGEVNKRTDKILVFCETKKGSDILCQDLRYNKFHALAIHGDKEQHERDRILQDFKQGRCHILIATDVASRGLGQGPYKHNRRIDICPYTCIYTSGCIYVYCSTFVCVIDLLCCVYRH